MSNLFLHIQGADATPETVRASELSMLMENYELALKGIVERDFANVDESDFFISLISIDRGSTRLYFSSEMPEIAAEASKKLHQAIIDNALESLPSDTQKAITAIQQFVKESARTVGVGNGNTEVLILPKQEPPAEEMYYTGETSIYGVLLAVGGARPKAKIRLNTGEILNIEISREIAKKLSPQLYETVGLTGIAKWRAIDWTILSFDVAGMLPYQEMPLDIAMQVLSEAASPYWDSMDADEFMREMRDDEKLI